MYRVPDALSRLHESDRDEVEVAAFEEVKWYPKRLEEIRESPKKYKSWRMEDDMVY